MKKPDRSSPKLTKNEQTVLKRIIEEAKTPDLEIAQEIGISQQAIFKIRHKLEHLGIIKGYTPIIDFKKIGVGTFAMVCIKFTNAVWERYSEEQLAERIQKIPEVILSYRIPESAITHILVIGFKDMDAKERYLMKLQTKYADEIEIVHVYPFSAERVIKENHIGLLNMILDKTESLSNEFFLDK